jgi:hypothetical protein
MPSAPALTATATEKLVSPRNTSVEDFALLHATRIKGIMPPAAAAEIASVDIVSELIDWGLVRLGARGLSLTKDGLRRHADLLDEHRAGADVITLTATYERFLSLNAPVKAACSTWQQSTRDPEALFQVADELSGFRDRLAPALAKAAQVSPWFEAYGIRLTVAADLAMEGDERFVTDPAVDSFHNIWFECHEDYLVTLGRSREEEEAS